MYAPKHPKTLKVAVILYFLALVSVFTGAWVTETFIHNPDAAQDTIDGARNIASVLNIAGLLTTAAAFALLIYTVVGDDH